MKFIAKLIIITLFIVPLSCNGTKNRTNNSPSGISDTSDSSLFSENITEDKYIKGLKDKYGWDNKDIWGQGIISNTNRNESDRLNFPDQEINVYNEPNGEIIGKIIKPDNIEYYNLYFENTNDNKKIKIDIKDLMEINNEGTCLKYYDRKNDFIQCLLNLHNGGLWIQIDDLKNHGYSPVDWKTFLIQTDRCYHPVSSVDILIYDIHENVTDTLKRGVNVIKLIESKNDYIKIELYKEDECGGCTDILTGTGWCKIIDENGHPKIFFYTRGC